MAELRPAKTCARVPRLASPSYFGMWGVLGALRHRLAWFAGRGCFDSLFAAIYSRIFQPRGERV
jgi:hypothetical protein